MADSDDDDLIELVLDDAGDKMDKAVDHARHEFSTVRTGRASPALVEKLPVDYYGSEVPLQQLAGFSVPEARLLVITPVRQGLGGRHREGDPRLRPRPQPEQRRQRHPAHLPAAHRGAAQGARAGRARAWPRRARSRCATSAARPATTSRRSRRTATSPRTTSRGPRRSSTR